LLALLALLLVLSDNARLWLDELDEPFDEQACATVAPIDAAGGPLSGADPQLASLVVSFTLSRPDCAAPRVPFRVSPAGPPCRPTGRPSPRAPPPTPSA